MRLVLKLKSTKTVVQNKENNSKFYTGMHGWIYDKLKDTDFSGLHSKNEFKLFCFSNLFNVEKNQIEEGKVYGLIISSPSEMFMVVLLSKINLNETINLGEYSFVLASCKPIGKKEIHDKAVLESETLVNICINENGKRKAITLSKNPKLFKENLAKNLIKKYYQYSNENENDLNLWENLEIEEIERSESAIKINIIKDSDNWFNVIGARYRFKIGEIKETQRKILQLCYDLGFGERNSFGFGFMNLKDKKKEEGEDD